MCLRLDEFSWIVDAENLNFNVINPIDPQHDTCEAVRLTGGAHSRVEASITSSTSPPYVAKQLTALFHTQPLYISLGCHTVLIPVKSQPSTRSIWPRSPTRLGIRPQDVGLLYKYSLGHCIAFLLLLDASLLSQADITHYSQLLIRQHSTKLLT